MTDIVTAGHVIAKIVSRTAGLDYINLASISFRGGYHGGNFSVEEQHWLRKARRVASRTGLPFWDILFAKATRSRSLSKGLILSAAAENERQPIYRVSRNEINESTIDQICGQKNNEYIVALSSVTINEQTHHIPMLDFQCKISKENLGTASAIMATIGEDGYILSSGNSYHFYGSRLMLPDEMTKFLGKCLVYAPIVDRAWIAHQLIRGECALRVSAKSNVMGPPVLLHEICNGKALSARTEVESSYASLEPFAN